MLSLNHPVGLRVIRGRLLLGNAQGGSQSSPQVRCELPTLVRNDGVGDAVTGHPVTQKGRSTGLGCDVRERDGFQPPRETINDGQQISAALRFW